MSTISGIGHKQPTMPEDARIVRVVWMVEITGIGRDMADAIMESKQALADAIKVSGRDMTVYPDGRVVHSHRLRPIETKTAVLAPRLEIQQKRP